MKRSPFNIILFLALYIILTQAFYAYVGLATPGGKLSSSFVNAYLNFPYWLSVFMAKATKAILLIFNYDVYQSKPTNVTISGSRGITIAWGCLGVGAACLWIAFIAAHRYLKNTFKVKWIIPGLLLIFLLNLGRMLMIALSQHYSWQYLQHFDAHNSFNILTYILIAIMMFLFVKKFNNHKEEKQQEENVSWRRFLKNSSKLPQKNQEA
jgi:exosortase/archaeosortase family protein